MCLAVPGKITEITEAGPLRRTGRVDFSGIIKQVNLAYVPEANIGDYVIVHVGFAISLVDKTEAAKVFEYLREMDELKDLKVPSPLVGEGKDGGSLCENKPPASILPHKGGGRELL